MEFKTKSNIGEIDKKFLEANNYIKNISQMLAKIKNDLIEEEDKEIYNELEK